jgi:hypothetical protein
LFDYAELPDAHELSPRQQMRWVCRLRRKTTLRSAPATPTAG